MTMKKTLLLIMIATVSVASFSQGRKYRKLMAAAMEQTEGVTGLEASLQSAGQFDAIADRYNDQWLPLYHSARVLTFACFGNQDGPRVDSLLDRAQVSLDRAFELEPSESELYALQALAILARITVDPFTRGAEYFEDLNSALDKAKALNPENPRTYYLQALLILNLPDYMGGGPGPAKPIFEEAAAKFESFSNKDPFWPGWGEDLNRTELERL
jgi:tetratricopeptide (TPR) repeat protein